MVVYRLRVWYKQTLQFKHLRCVTANNVLMLVRVWKRKLEIRMVPPLSLLSCESSVYMKQNLDWKNKRKKVTDQSVYENRTLTFQKKNLFASIITLDKSSSRSQDIKIFVLTFWTCWKNILIRKISLISKFMTLQPGWQRNIARYLTN